MRNHGKTIPADQKGIIEGHLTLLGIPPELPIPYTTVVAQIDGLRTHDALYCPDCPSTFLAEDSLKKHRREQHQHIRPRKPVTKGPAQRFNNGAGVYRTFFRVHVPPPPEDIDRKKPVYDILQEIEAGQKSLVPETDVRNVTPWLRVTKWHEYFKGIDTQSLRAMVEHPTTSEFPDLAHSVLYLFVKASDYIENTTTLVLEKLNSPDPQKQYALYYFL